MIARAEITRLDYTQIKTMGYSTDPRRPTASIGDSGYVPIYQPSNEERTQNRSRSD